MWFRVFGLVDSVPTPDELMDHLRESGIPATGQFKGDDPGWTSGEIACAPGGPILLERWLSKEDDLRGDLMSWSAWLESTGEYSTEGPRLMERIFRTQQLITLRRPIDVSDEILLDRLCEGVCRFLASRTDGLYQRDGEGFFTPDGTLLVREY
jgi:hypothetical protein